MATTIRTPAQIFLTRYEYDQNLPMPVAYNRAKKVWSPTGVTITPKNEKDAITIRQHISR